MNPQDLQSSPKPFTRTTIDDKSGLLGATASAITPAKFGPSGGVGVTNAFAGAEVTAKANFRRVFPRTLTITTAAHAASYKTGAGNPLVVTGLVNGQSTIENFLLMQTNGNETIRGTTLWDDPTQVTVDVPAQNDALGSFTVGVGDIGGPGGNTLRGFKVHSDANVVVKGDDGFFDVAAAVAGVVEPTNCARICVTGAGVTTSAVGITVYA